MRFFGRKERSVKPSNHLNLLGLRVKDKVTEIEGVVTGVNFDLYGCIQGYVSTEKPDNDRWYDVSRLEVLSDKPVMPAPNFSLAYSEEREDKEEKDKIIAQGNKGGSAKPAPGNF